jgi:Big-like domain-containing protein
MCTFRQGSTNLPIEAWSVPAENSYVFRAHSISLVLLSIAVSGCSATAPVAPSAVPARLVLLVQGGATRLDSVLQFNVYLADTDDVYTDVTTKAQWSVSNPSILQLFGGNSFLVRAQGTVSILATSQGMAAVLPVTVAPQTFTSTIPPVRLSPFFGPGDLNGIGHTKTVNAIDQQANNVNNVATWTSGDPSIVTVSQGVVTAVGVGTTTITVAYAGGVDSCLVSVYPNTSAR